jgi:hypothetical protein
MIMTNSGFFSSDDNDNVCFLLEGGGGGGGGGGILIYPCPSGYRYMVCPAVSSYSFGAIALIFCRMLIHIMEVCMSTGF